MAGSLPDIEVLGIEDLQKLVLQVLEENARLRAENAHLREEIRRLKGLKGPPSLKPSKPSGMDKASEPKTQRGPGRRAPKNARLAIDEDHVLKADVPSGSRFKGYEDYLVQDLVVKPRVIRYRRERWLTPEGARVVAPLPAGIRGHFGPELQRFVLAQYTKGQTTVERLAACLRDLGLDISKRQVVRLLTAGHDGFLDEDRAVLRAGLEAARWISVDDTGARHQNRNAVATRIGNHCFAWFATTFPRAGSTFLSCCKVRARPPTRPMWSTRRRSTIAARAGLPVR